MQNTCRSQGGDSGACGIVLAAFGAAAGRGGLPWSWQAAVQAVGMAAARWLHGAAGMEADGGLAWGWWHGGGWHGGWAGPAVVGGLAAGALLAAPYAYGGYGGYGYGGYGGCGSYAPIYDVDGN